MIGKRSFCDLFFWHSVKAIVLLSLFYRFILDRIARVEDNVLNHIKIWIFQSNLPIFVSQLLLSSPFLRCVIHYHRIHGSVTNWRVHIAVHNMRIHMLRLHLLWMVHTIDVVHVMSVHVMLLMRWHVIVELHHRRVSGRCLLLHLRRHRRRWRWIVSGHADWRHMLVMWVHWTMHSTRMTADAIWQVVINKTVRIVVGGSHWWFALDCTWHLLRLLLLLHSSEHMMMIVEIILVWWWNRMLHRLILLMILMVLLLLLLVLIHISGISVTSHVRRRLLLLGIYQVGRCRRRSWNGWHRRWRERRVGRWRWRG